MKYFSSFVFVKYELLDLMWFSSLVYLFLFNNYSFINAKLKQTFLAGSTEEILVPIVMNGFTAINFTFIWRTHIHCVLLTEETETQDKW